MKKSVIVIIPARGGSKGIPRKNLRPVAGKPLISYGISTALELGFVDKVVVTTEDDEIALISERFGAEVVRRPYSISDDDTPLDPVIFYTLREVEKSQNQFFDIIITIQPTSPLVNSEDIKNVIDILSSGKYDTSQTVVDDRHLCWTIKDRRAVPLYEERVNRQSLPLNYRETGAVIGCTREQIATGSRIGERVALVEVPQSRSFDIDNFSDLYLCEAMLNRKKVIFTVIGSSEVGLGHAFRTILLAHELVNYEILFICEDINDLAIKYIKSFNYNIILCESGCLSKTVISHKPDLVINDILDTSLEYMSALKLAELKCVNFEDLGKGHLKADLVINALYPDKVESQKVLTGEKYFCVRDEFLYIKKKKRVFDNTVGNILLTFGGVDELNLTCKVLNSILAYSSDNSIEINIVLGPGFKHLVELNLILEQTTCVNVFKNTKRISDFMNNADIAFTSGGRTVLELASLEVPTLVICQNERETTHTFASEVNGVLNLGIGYLISEGQILDSLVKIVNNPQIRKSMSTKMAKLDLKSGKKIVLNKIENLINN